MSYYSGKLIIHNETEEYNKFNPKELGQILSIRFSINFNKEKLFLSNTLVNQFLSSKAVQKYIVSECDKYMNDNLIEIDNNIRKIFTIENEPKVKISVIGKYFYVKINCGRNHNRKQLIAALKRKLQNEKTLEEILRGD